MTPFARFLVLLALVAATTFGLAQTRAQVAHQLADGLRRSITGTEVRCPGDFHEQGGACFEANYTVDSGARLTASIVGDLPGVGFISPWESGSGRLEMQSRILTYRGAQYAVFVIDAGVARVLIMFLPW